MVVRRDAPGFQLKRAKALRASQCFDAYTSKRGSCELADKHSNLYDEVSLSWIVLLHENFAVRIHVGKRHHKLLSLCVLTHDDTYKHLGRIQYVASMPTLPLADRFPNMIAGSSAHP